MYQYAQQPQYSQPPPSSYQASPPPVPAMNGGGYPGYPPQTQQRPYGEPQSVYGGYGHAPPPPQPPSQPSYYGNPAASTSYGNSRYPQPAPQYAPPPQVQLQPQPYNLAVDPNVFQGYYSHELRGLTFNSKPIINGLTILAQEHAGRMAPVVAQCLEDHIRQTHTTTKLPPLYLLDSICKNVGQPYTILFASTIDRILLSAYYEVDAPTRTKLEELVGTWRNGGPDRRELFPLPPDAPPGTRPAQQIIEETIWGRRPEPQIPTYPSNGMNHQLPQQYHHASMSPPPPPIYPQAMPPVPPPHFQHPQARPPTPPQASPATANAAEKAAVLFDLRKLLALRKEQALGNPADKNNAGQIVTLQALEQLVLNSQLGSAQVGQIRDQLARLAPAQPPRLATPPTIPKIESEEDEYNRGSKRQRLMSPSQAGLRGTPPITGPLNPAIASLTSLLNPNIIRTASAQGIRASATPPPAFGQMPLSQAATPVPAPATLPGGAHPALADALAGLDPKLLATFTGAAQATNDAVALTRVKDANERALAAYEHHRLHFRVQLQNSDIARYRPGSSALIHEAMPLGCKQCGNRYLDSPSGKDRLAKDLDRHLRISRRYTEGIGAQRAVGRSWFAMEEEWVLPPSAIQPSAAVVKNEQDKKQAADKAQILNQTVRVPEGAATNDELSKCPICKETFKNEYSESEEDWVWRNAIELDGKFYHASCKAEQGGDD